MKKIFTIFALALICFGATAQSVTLTFTGRDAQNHHVQLNHVVITNLTRDWEETIYNPEDTILMMGGTGVDDFDNSNEFKLSQNVPNPFEGATDFELQMAEAGHVSLSVFDLTGRKITAYQGKLSAGIHVFRVILRTPQSFVLTARCGNHVDNIKMINSGQAGENAIRYMGEGMSHRLNMLLKGGDAYPFSVGDEMRYVGYATVNGMETMSQPIQKHQTASEEIILVFGTAGVDDGQPCQGTATLTDIEGNVYNTVQIGGQCWMKENLRTTKYADGTAISVGNTGSSITAYWYSPNNDYSNRAVYGLLYNRAAVMRNSSSSESNPSGVQGICPTGWHVPSEAEWKQLVDYVGNQSEYVCGSVNTYIAKALAATIGWYSSGGGCDIGNNLVGNNATGFSALPAGYYGNGYYNFGKCAWFWSATEHDNEYYPGGYRSLHHNRADLGSGGIIEYGSISVRCLRDKAVAELPAVSTLPVSDITATTAVCGGNVTSDGGATVIARGVCWSISENPTLADNYTTNNTGTGEFTSSLTGLSAGTTYYVRAYATNFAGTSYGEEITFNTTPTGQPCSNMTTVNDIDGNTYNMVQIGNQCWMRENLKTTKYADGTSIAQGSTYSSNVAYWYYPNNQEANKSTYGLLYNWKAVMRNSSSSIAKSGVQGICPTGWHVPSDDEWTQLTTYVSNQCQYQCNSNSAYIAKALASTTGWISSTYTCAVGNTQSANNATGFGALPAGYYDGSYYYFGMCAWFWSASKYFGHPAYTRLLSNTSNYVHRNDGNYESHGFSVRCLRDN